MDGPVKAGTDELVLYFAYGSFFSDKARIGLLEKGLTFREVVLDLSTQDNLAPWYLRICPGGTVPTLQHGDKFIPDSAAVLKYLDANFGEPLLQPDPESDIGRQVAELYAQLGSLNVGVLTYGSAYHQDLTVECAIPKEVIIKRKGLMDVGKEKMQKLMEDNPDLKDVYLEKCEAVQKKSNLLFDRALLETEIGHAREVMAQFEKHLTEASEKNCMYLFGDYFTVADITLAILLNRFRMVGLAKVLFQDKLPMLTRYFQRVHDRPSFKQVCVAFMQEGMAKWTGKQQ